MSKYNYHLTGQNSDFAKIMAKIAHYWPHSGGGRHSRWLMWWSWELRGCMVAGNGGDDGGGG